MTGLCDEWGLRPDGSVRFGAFESVAVLWNRVEEYDGDTGALARRLHAWCEAAQVDRERARAWARARIVEDALDRLTGACGPRSATSVSISC